MQDDKSRVPTAPGSCPSDDELALFLEGRLAEPRLGEVRQHVADCPDCYEIYADAHLFEMEARDPKRKRQPDTVARGGHPETGALRLDSGNRKVLPFVDPEPAAVPFTAPIASPPNVRRRPWTTAILPLAAGLVLAAISFPFVARSAPVRPAPLDPMTLSRQVAGASRSSASVLRGGPETAKGSDLYKAALQGELLVDLAVALNQGRHREVDMPLGKLIEAAKAVAATQDAGMALGPIRQRLGDVTDRQLTPQEITYLRDGALKILVVFGPDEKLRELRNRQDLGQWREAGLLAADSQDPRFFASRDNRDFLAWLRGPAWGSSPIPLTRAGKATLKEIAKSWPDPVAAVTPLDYASLEAGFSKLRASEAPAAP